MRSTSRAEMLETLEPVETMQATGVLVVHTIMESLDAANFGKKRW